MTAEELLQLKTDIETAKQTIAELKGSEKQLLKELKETYGCTTLKEAESKLKKMEVSLLKLNNEIEQGLTELEEKYEFN